MGIENFSEFKNENLRDYCAVEVYNPQKLSWDEIGQKIVEIELSASGEKPGLDEEILKEAFEDSSSVAIITKDTRDGKIVGFTIAQPTAVIYPEDFPDRQPSEDTAYITDSAFEKSYQGHGLIVPMIEELERQLIAKGFSFMERDSADDKKDKDSTTEETYADKIRKNYKDRILKEESHDSEYGPQVFFRIRLKKSDEKPEENLEGVKENT